MISSYDIEQEAVRARGNGVTSIRDYANHPTTQRDSARSSEPAETAAIELR